MLLKIYLIGIIVAWILFKIIRIKDKDDTWEGLLYSIFFSLVSWLGVIMAIAFFLPKSLPEDIANKISRWFKRNNPPKWL
jgi:hypothetical protein